MKNKKNNEIRIFLNTIIGFLSLSLFSIGSGFSLGEKQKGSFSGTMKLDIKNADNQPIDFFEDIVNAKTIDNWLSNIIRKATSFSPLKLVINIDGNRTVLIEHSMFVDNALEIVDKLSELKDPRFNIPNDSLEMLIDLDSRSASITIS